MSRFAPLLMPVLATSLCLQVRAGTLSLDGSWQATWTKTVRQPGPDSNWAAVDVPARQTQRSGFPFLWYRRTFDLPAEMAGQRLFLRFEGVKYVSTVIVNGVHVGGHFGGFEPFECDATEAVRQLQTNEVLVCVQDVTGLIGEPMDYAKQGPGVRFIDQAKDSILAPIGSQYYRFGIWQPVSLVSRNDLYVDDVYVRTSVRRKRLEADIALRNLSNRDLKPQVAVKVAQTALVLDVDPVSVPAGGTTVVHATANWARPRLWCPDDPHVYHLVTTVSEAGTTSDETHTLFGFREFWIDGETMLLNGIPMKFLATAGHPSHGIKASLKKEDAADYYRRLRAAGCVAMRLHANVWPRAWFEAADEVGMPLIMESALFCYANAYALTKQEFWDNYHEHLRAMVRVHRNHPSVVMTSLENEILHCGGEGCAKDCEHRLAEAGRLVKRLDPTRPIMYDADGDPEGVADVFNLHYPLKFDEENLWPNAAWWLADGKELGSWPRTFYAWDRKKPLYFGEFLHLQHYNQPDPYTVLLGDSAYPDFDDAMARCKAAAWAMQIQAYRGADVSGLCPWVVTETGDFPADDNPRYLAVKRGYAKHGAFIREYDRHFFSGERVRRTVDLYNDTPRATRLKLSWMLTKDTRKVAAGEREINAKPADHLVLPIEVTMPAVTDRTAVTLALTVFEGADIVFAESHPLCVFPRRPLRLPDGVAISVYEGENHAVGKALEAAGCRPALVTDLQHLPDGGLLIVGPHALDSRHMATNGWVIGNGASPRQALAQFVRAGGGVIVLEQNAYADVLPAELTDRGCTIAFVRTPGALPSVRSEDCMYWRGDHVVARKTIMKPESGRFRTLVDSGGPDGLVNAALVEFLDGQGRMLLSQLAIGEKLATEPMASCVLEDMIARALRSLSPHRLGVVQQDAGMTDMLTDIDARFIDLSHKLDETDMTRFRAVLADANCEQVAASQVKLRTFVESGGSLILHGATALGLKRLAALLPETVTAQQSCAVPVTISTPDPLIAGLSNQELHWYGSRNELNWRERTPLSTDVCSHALFAGLPEPSACRAVEAETMTLADGAGRVTDSGVYMHTYGLLETTVDTPVTGEYALFVRGKGTPVEGIYPRIRVTVDGRPVGALTLATNEWTFAATVVRVEKGNRRVGLAFVNDSWDPETREDRNVHIDKLLVGPMRKTRARRLFTPAALVVMPLGTGLLIIDQVNWHRETLNKTKARRYLSTLLTNLDVDFASPAAGITVPGARLTPTEGVKLYRTQQGEASLGANGRLYFDVTVRDDTRYELAINASGTQAGGEFPSMSVDIDGKAIGSVQLSRAGWCTLRQPVDLLKGARRIGISFTNDFYDPPEDRNLRIRSVALRPVEETER